MPPPLRGRRCRRRCWRVLGFLGFGGLGFRVLGFWVLGFGFRVLGLGFRVLGFWGFGFLGFWVGLSSDLSQVKGLQFRVQGQGFQRAN